MKVNKIYDHGSSPYWEDGLVIAPPRYAVFDGVSAPFSPDTPIKLFGGINGIKGLSGGEMTARLIEGVFRAARSFPEATIERVFLAASAAVGGFQVEAGIPLDDAGKLAGATFAGVKVDETVGRVYGLQGGDVFALIAYRNGRIFLTQNQVQGHDTVMNAMINDFKRKIAEEHRTTLEKAKDDKALWDSIIGEMWNRFRLPLERARREDVNNQNGPRGGYALLNGQGTVKRLWVSFSLPRESVETIILFSDGLVPWEGVLKKHSGDQIASWIYENFKLGGREEEGLRYLLNIARGIEKDTFVEGYTTNAEATAIALEF